MGLLWGPAFFQGTAGCLSVSWVPLMARRDRAGSELLYLHYITLSIVTYFCDFFKLLFHSECWGVDFENQLLDPAFKGGQTLQEPPLMIYCRFRWETCIHAARLQGLIMAFSRAPGAIRRLRSTGLTPTSLAGQGPPSGTCGSCASGTAVPAHQPQGLRFLTCTEFL